MYKMKDCESNTACSIFDILDDEGKNYMIEDICISIAEDDDASDKTLLEFLRSTRRITENTYKKIMSSIHTIRCYISTPHSEIQDVPYMLKHYNEVESIVNNRFLNIDKIDSFIEREKVIDSIVEEFVNTGNYLSYLTLKDIKFNYGMDRGRLGNKISFILEDALLARYRRVNSV
ncbi:hypothetical protein [Turkeypox virus]|uniref:Uncharacterized protein n=1 Tax=Turkeypox virus TaxID=336486 RepID=A0A0M3ZCT4_9POXV|nr:hypothetical protein ASN15_gp118 [Turkeypox virus]ALA62492.1 hypothetical protein [Turkeypox virus]